MMIFVVTPGESLRPASVHFRDIGGGLARSCLLHGALALYSDSGVAGASRPGAGLSGYGSELLEVPAGLRPHCLVQGVARAYGHLPHAMRNALVNVMSVLGLQVAASSAVNILELPLHIPASDCC